MNYTDYTSDPLGQVLVVAVAFVIIAFFVLLILLPFYVQSINTWTRSSHKELKKIRQILERQERSENQEEPSGRIEPTMPPIMRESQP
jgi:predicted PurR-regulated permease PerM